MRYLPARHAISIPGGQNPTLGVLAGSESDSCATKQTKQVHGDASENY
jgi:hypothetical protein